MEPGPLSSGGPWSLAFSVLIWVGLPPQSGTGSQAGHSPSSQGHPLPHWAPPFLASASHCQFQDYDHPWEAACSGTADVGMSTCPAYRELLPAVSPQTSATPSTACSLSQGGHAQLRQGVSRLQGVPSNAGPPHRCSANQLWGIREACSTSVWFLVSTLYCPICWVEPSASHLAPTPSYALSSWWQEGCCCPNLTTQVQVQWETDSLSLQLPS